MNFVFFGTAEFGIPALEALCKAGHTLKAVVTNPPKPAGRGLQMRPSPVDLYCERSGITTVIRPDSLKDESFIEQLSSLSADIYVVVAYSILPEVVFSIPPMGTFNIHAALLPSFRGPAPIHRAIESGAVETGVTVFKIDRGVDTGNVLLKKSVDIEERDTTPTLYERLSLLSGEAICEAFSIIESGVDSYEKQDHSLATSAPLLKKSEGLISWDEPAQVIERRVRAFQPFPGVYTFIKGKKVDILSSHTVDGVSGAKPGEVVLADKSGFAVQCGDGALFIDSLKPAGKKLMSSGDYVNGSIIKKGINLDE